MGAFFGSIAQWILKIFLGGLFNKVMTQIEDEAGQKEKAAQLHAETTEDACETEIAIVKDQVAAEKSIKDAPKTQEDPFGNNDWNARP